MKHIQNISLLAAALICAATAIAETVTYKGKPGSSVTISGTSTVHDWTVESKLIGGSMEITGDLNKPGKVEAKVESMISVRSIKSDKKAMDDVMQAAMKADEHKRIDFKLKELIAEGGMKFKATGDLSVAGVTKEVKFPVTMEKGDDNAMKVKGELDTKMTDFGIQPPSPAIAGGMIKTGDDVKIVFEWLTQKK
jgi:polyisoprenoid-binding protein YceI